MSEKTLHRAEAQIVPPNESTGYPGQTAQGMYIYEDGIVTLCDYDGNPVQGPGGRTYSNAVPPDVAPVVTARRLVKQFTLARRGNDRRDFNRVLHYKRDGSVV